jgi:hypothetical protein
MGSLMVREACTVKGILGQLSAWARLPIVGLQVGLAYFSNSCKCILNQGDVSWNINLDTFYN